MKKLFYLLLGFSLLSCSRNDNIIEEEPTTNIQTERAYVYCTDGVGEKPHPAEYYELTYENGNLARVKGRFYPVFVQFFNRFFSDPITTLTYSGNTVTVSEDVFIANGYYEDRYTMESNRPQKKESYYVYPGTNVSLLGGTKTYTYEQDKLKNVYWKLEGPGNYESFTTYYYDDKNNLTKSEFLQKHNGKEEQLITTTYSDFDNAENPFKKLYLLNDTFYEKSLSANNFRKSDKITVNLNSSIPPKTETKTWSYKYDTNGQVLLYFPYP